MRQQRARALQRHRGRSAEAAAGNMVQATDGLRAGELRLGARVNRQANADETAAGDAAADTSSSDSDDHFPLGGADLGDLVATGGAAADLMRMSPSSMPFVDEWHVGQEVYSAPVAPAPIDMEESSRRTMALAQDLGERGLATEFDPTEARRGLTTTGPDFDIGTARCMPRGELKTFLLAPSPKNAAMIECRIIRERTGKHKLSPKYIMESDSGVFLMAAQKQTYSRTSNYVVTMSQTGAVNESSEATIGTVLSDFLGLNFVAYGAGVDPKKIDPHMVEAHAIQLTREEHLLVQYSSSLWGAKPRGPRKMSVSIPRVLPSGERLVRRTLHPEKDGLLAIKRSGSSGNLVDAFQNKPPKWNEQIGAFVLNFNRRVTKASVKNFQLTNSCDSDTVFLQFGRVDKDVFNIDFRYPLSPFQAFAICLSSFDYKLCCE